MVAHSDRTHFSGNVRFAGHPGAISGVSVASKFYIAFFCNEHLVLGLYSYECTIQEQFTQRIFAFIKF